MPADLQKLQGRWYITALETNGRRMEPAAFGGASIVIKGKAFESYGMGQIYRGTIELKTVGRTKTVDLVFIDGPQQGTRNRGIYRLTRDRWTICLATRGDVRPKTFATTPESGIALEIFAREPLPRSRGRQKPTSATSSSKSPRADDIVPTGPPTELEGEWDMVSGVFSGAALAADMVKWCKRHTRGNITTVIAGPQTMVKATFTLDAAAQPPVIDYISLLKGSAGKSQAGIYDLRDGMLRVCMAAAGKPRPADFSSRTGDGRSLTTWRRAAD